MNKIRVDCRENIPLVLQEDCDEIYAAILVNTIRGEAAYRQIEISDGTFVGRIFGPKLEENGNK